MPEYIEVDQMWKCETCFHHRSGKCALGMFGCDHGESYRPAYSKLKKADVAPVVHGRWIITKEYNDVIEMDVVKYACSVCKEYRLSATGLSQATNYCPNCGARMKDGE